ncbi:Aminoacyl-tRNA editing domain family protein [Leishmania donovani]|uniref:Aminoacyl-tRNA editing domain family protein n=1 Tax=Leishmania donovani TaxID=5661 RepID=A0A504XC01_LEIDO|nr:Aminoacyl-tRNA editing domain family protein [Leishmania donovani]
MKSRLGVSARCSTALWRRSLCYGCRESVSVPAGSLSVSTSQTPLTTTPAPPNTPHCHRGTGVGGTASSSGGGVSLGDLAKVFQQLSSDNAGGAQQDQGGHSSRGDAAAPMTATTIAAAAAAASPLGTPQEVNRGGSADAPQGRSEPASQWRSISSAGATSGGTPASYYTPPQPRKQQCGEAAAHRSLISLSPLYAARLTTLTEAQLCTELESRLGRLDYSSMMQCLHEVVRRWSPTPTTSAVADGAADGDDSDACRAKRRRRAACKQASEAEDVMPSAARTFMANQRLLTAVLSVLKRMDLCVMEAEWLSREVSRMDATASLQVLHLLAQQRLLHMEAVLKTLVDSIVVHLERCGSAEAATPGPESTARAFTLEEYSLLFDTLARFQAQLLRLSYLRQFATQEPHGVHPSAAELRDGTSVVDAEGTEATVIAAGATDPCLVSAAAAVRRRALEQSNHPVANGRLFHHLAEALSLALMNGQQGHLPASMAGAATNSIDAADTSARMLRMNATSFLFLTRALSKLQWWHDGLAAALAAPLTGYVRAHPESALVVVGLVGRRENRSGDVALLEVLQDSLITLLLRRRGALKARTEMGQAPRQGRAAGMDGDADVEGGTNGLVSQWAQDGGDGATGESTHLTTRAGTDDGEDHEAVLAEWEEGGEADLRLLSSSASYTTPATHRRSRGFFAASVSTASSTPSVEASTPCGVTPAPPPEPPASNSAASLTFIDLHALPGTVEALCRFHMRTIAAVPPPREAGAGAAGTSGEDVRARLVRKMRELLGLMLDDTSRGITSLDAVARTFAPAFLSRALLTLLEATAQLPQAWGTIGGPDASLMRRGKYTSTATADSPHHPFVIELAAAAAVAYHRIAASAYWRRAVVVHEALVKAGLLCCTRPHAAYASDPAAALRGRYYMPDDVLRAAPRVNAAVQLAKTRIEARRQLEAAERPEVEEQEQQKAAASRYASVAIRDSAQRRRASAASSSSRSPQHQCLRAMAEQPARTTDVFAGYTKAHSQHRPTATAGVEMERCRQHLIAKAPHLAERVQAFAESSATVELAAIRLGCDPAHIAKSLSFLLKKPTSKAEAKAHQKMMREVSAKKYKEKFACQPKMLKREEVEPYTGFPPGGVCPFGLNDDVRVYLDVSLKRFPYVYPAAGTTNTGIKVTVDELEQYASNAVEWVDLCEGWQPEEGTAAKKVESEASKSAEATA